MNATKDSIKRLFNEYNEKDYWENVDFHLHSNASDGKLPADELAKQARAKG